MPLSAREIEPALEMWSETAGARASLVNHSENQTFRIDTVSGPSFMLRVHRQGYQSEVSVESELAWLMALRRDTDLPIPEPVPGRDGALLQQFSSPQAEHMAVLFHHIPGREPSPDSDLRDVFRKLGGYAATMHNHVMGWQPPPGFHRQVWEAAAILDADGLWGDWRVAPGVTEQNRPILNRLDSTLWLRLADYGIGPDRYGLIHADMRLGNLLVEGEKVNLIDFDDCGFCWFAYDFAAAISFHETSPAMPVLKQSWLQGYQAIRALSEQDVAAIDSMVMLRRMALLAWIGSHSETRLAQQHMPGFADGTARLAERYMRGALWE